MSVQIFLFLCNVSNKNKYIRVSNPFPKLSFEGKFSPELFRGATVAVFLEREQGAAFFKQTGKPAILKNVLRTISRKY